ncbi:uncharacterized protein [Rhodnius prolixus]|uniref:uncharacterized protein n=1 Tax=Rhodnius prolixus TaxID=13249 RepID=UPI003D189769
MNRKHKRKQILFTRSEHLEEEGSTMSSGYDPFMCAGPDKNEFLTEEPLISPTEWGMESISDTSLLPIDRSAASSLDLCPTSDLYADECIDVNAILEMDLSDPVSLCLEDPAQENQEVFQDVKYTSTPKSRGLNTTSSSLTDSSRKRPRFHVLHDITDSINCSNNESFININHVLDTTPPQILYNDSEAYKLPGICTPPPSFSKKSEKLSPNLCASGRKVSIIRKKLPLRTPDPPITPDFTTTSSFAFTSTSLNEEVPKPSQKSESLATLSKSPPLRKKTDEEQLTYYSGINCYDLCIALLKHIKLAPSSHLSTFKMQMIMLMKLRLDLQWKDIAFRYESREQIVKRVFYKTLDVFSECLVELLPWQLNKRNARKNCKAYLIYTLRKHDYQVVLIIGDNRKPVNFVSARYLKDEDPLAIVLNECSAHLVKGDMFCLDDTFLRVEEHGGRWCFLQKNNLPRLPSMNYQQDVIAQMLTLYPLTSLEEDTDLSKVMTVVGALINLNHLSTISISTLRAIYERSVRLATKEA